MNVNTIRIALACAGFVAMLSPARVMLGDDDKRVETTLEYRAVADASAERRVVEPRLLFHRDGQWYLAAWNVAKDLGINKATPLDGGFSATGLGSVDVVVVVGTDLARR